ELLLLRVFFFSSRRRHTRFSRDWSSDVCSSDLLSWKAIWLAVQNGKHHLVQRAINEHVERYPVPEQDLVRLRTIHIVRDTQRQRSEERRVGQECRSRWSADHQKEINRVWKTSKY